MIITDIAQLLAAGGAFISAVVGLHNARKLTTVHKAVNSTAMAQNQRTDQLTAALTDANVAVPARPADPPGH